MGRRIVIRKEKINEYRAVNWERHYKNRELAKQLISIGSVNPLRILTILVRELPKPELDFDASVISFPLVDRVHASSIAHAYGVSDEMANVWYWSDSGWLTFVRAFQSLADPLEDYYLLYSVKTDVFVHMPMSSKPKQGSQKPVDKWCKCVDKCVDKWCKCVGKCVDNSGTKTGFQVQVSSKSTVFSE
jgi:hypothetical protein